MKPKARHKLGAQKTLPSAYSFALFGDEEFSGLLAGLERDVDRFVGVRADLPHLSAENVGRAKHFLEALAPLLKSQLKGRCDADQLFRVLELAAEAVDHPLRDSPKSRAEAIWQRRAAEVRNTQKQQGGWNKGNNKLAPHDERIKELFTECHGGGPKPLMRGWRKEMLAKLELDGIYTDADMLSERLKMLGLRP